MVRRKFIDVGWRPPLNDLQSLKRMLTLAQSIGYYGVAIENVPLDSALYKKITESTEKLSIYTRKTYSESQYTVNKLKNLLAKERKRFHLVVCHCLSTQLLKWALQDHRIDFIMVDLQNYSKLIDESAVKLAREHEKTFEIQYQAFASVHFAIWSLRNLFNMITKLYKKKLSPVLSSGAQNLLQIRPPRDLTALLTVITEDVKWARDSMSITPHSYIKKNLIKLHPSYLGPGVMIYNTETEQFLQQLEEEE